MLPWQRTQNEQRVRAELAGCHKGKQKETKKKGIEVYQYQESKV